MGDLATNVTVIVALLLAGMPGFLWVDAVAALAVAAIILKSAIDIGRGALDNLMDREMADADRARIIAIVQAHREALSLHDLRTRLAGNQPFIQFHLDLDPTMSLQQAHRIGQEIEAELQGAFPGAEIIIHHDPAGMAEAHPPLAKG